MGAIVDVIGMLIDELSESTVREVLEKHPRLGCKKRLIGLLDDQATKKSQSRIASAMEQLKLLDLIDQAPFAESSRV